MTDLKEASTNAEAFAVIFEISKELNTGLSREELLAALRLIESGADPTALALAVKQCKAKARDMIGRQKRK